MNISRLIMIVFALSAFVLSSNSAVHAAGSVGGSTKGNCTQTAEEKANAEAKAKITEPLVSQMAFRLFQFLEEKQAQVALVARAGGSSGDRVFRAPRHHPSSFTGEGHKYSHIGIAHRSPTGKWSFTHLLNERAEDCSGPSNKSNIYDQSLADFFRDDPWMMDIMISIPSSELAAKIVDVVEDQSFANIGLAKALHYPVYSNIANPFNTRSNKRQNSNQWALTIVAAAQSGLTSLSEVQGFYAKNGFTPSQVRVTGLESTFGKWFGMIPKNAYLDDHSSSEQASGWYNFVSAASLFAYLDKTDTPLLSQIEICPILNNQERCNIEVSELKKFVIE